MERKQPWPRLRELARRRIDSACEATGHPEWSLAGRVVLDELSGEWPSWEAGYDPAWPSDITDDGSPFELSLAFEGGDPTLRLLWEPQARISAADVAPAESSWEVGTNVMKRLEARGAQLDGYRRIEHLYRPLTSIPVRFSMWHACTLDASGPRDFKVYLNPQVVGVDGAMLLVARTMAELGLDSSFETVREALSEKSRPTYVSLDLGARESSRVKLYFAHPGESSKDVIAQLDASGALLEGVTPWVQRLAGGPTESLSRPLQTCLAFRPGAERPEASLYVPLRACVAHDDEAIDRLDGLLSPAERALARDAARAVTGRELTDGRGIVTYAGLRATARGPRVVVYLSPQLYAVQPARVPLDAQVHATRSSPSNDPPPRITRGSGVRERTDVPATVAELRALVDREQEKLAAHPFFARLRTEATLADIRRVAPRVAFFVMAFQDVLRLVTEKTTDPVLRQLARAHQLEDAGHDHWYLRDLEVLDLTADLATLFSRDARAIRDVSYHQVAEAISAESDLARFAVVLCLEAAGVSFFASMVDGLERLGRSDGLLYFSKKHQAVEASHEIFEDQKQKAIDAIRVPTVAGAEVVRAVTRTFETMRNLADHLEALVTTHLPEVRSA
ncbi:MAG: iron-containing redox enzyme family protein [Deltaproteobacteria bacterium]|nr:iron-containing redox enzyme family protein [Deltaproteobacteria bacterium]